MTSQLFSRRRRPAAQLSRPTLDAPAGRCGRPLALAAALAAGAAVLAPFVLAGCGHNTAKADTPPAYTATTTAAAAEVHPSLFNVPRNQWSHLQIVTVGPSRLVRTLQLPGTVEFNQFRTTPVLAPVGGPVTRILVVPGEAVRAGQPLLEIRSPDYSGARANYLSAQAAEQLAETNERRAQDLYEHHAIAQQDLEQAQATAAQAEAALQNAVAALRVLGVTDLARVGRQVSPILPVAAPIAGTVVARSVSPGELVAAGTQVFTISNTHTVWVQVHVYEQQLGMIAMGQPVAITTDAYPGKVFRGRISYLGATLDPQSRTLQARIVTANPGGLLKNQMFVTAQVRAGVIPNAIAVPDAAVLRDSVNHPFVYLATAQPGQFRRQLVDIGASQNGETQILAGLKAGERVLAQGAMFIQFASQLKD
ncbi:MAG: efflux RND transporter periplasmic adaptor subunit [Terriglobales bacterium]